MEPFEHFQDDAGRWHCGARTKTCRNCGRRYDKDERDLTCCPACGEERRCHTLTGPRRRCVNHGGRTPRGNASPNFKHGRYSKYLPAHLLDRYSQGQRDEQLLDLRQRIALLDVRLTELLEQLDGKRDAEVWLDIRALLQEQRQLIAAQWRREFELQQYVQVEEMLIYTSALLDAIRTHVYTFVPAEHARDFLSAVQSDVRRFTEHNDPGKGNGTGNVNL